MKIICTLIFVLSAVFAHAKTIKLSCLEDSTHFHFTKAQQLMLDEIPEEVLIRAKKLDENLYHYGLVMPNGEEMEFISEAVGYIKLGEVSIDLHHVEGDTVFVVNLRQQTQNGLDKSKKPELQE